MSYNTESGRSDFRQDMLGEARNYFIEGQYKMAETLLNNLLLQNSRNPEIYQMLATIYYDQGQFNKAIKTFRKALEIDPSYTDASVGLSIILNDLGKYEEGKQVFLDAQTKLDKAQNTQDPFVNEKLASKHEELADLYFQYKRFKESLEQLLKAQKLTSRKAEITMRLAEVYIQLAEPARAVKDLVQLVREEPQFLAARIKLGQVYYNLNRLAEASEQWENVLARDPRHPEALRLVKMAQAAGITTLDY